jgi:hypothetical protein
MKIVYRDGSWFEGNCPVSERYVAERLEALSMENQHIHEFYGVRDTVVSLWEQGELEPEPMLTNQMLRIGELRAALDRTLQERDWQYEENVNRIAAQGRAELEACMWEWVARKYVQLYRTCCPWIVDIPDMLDAYAEEHPYG